MQIIITGIHQPASISLSMDQILFHYNLDIQSPSSNYEVSDFFPNPFIPVNHKRMLIFFITSKGNEILNVAMLIDGAGQKVKEYLKSPHSHWLVIII